MFIIEKEFFQTLEIKKSKFIAHLIPYNLFKIRLQELKQKHLKGKHFVYAFRYQNEFKQIVEGSSDDGEPKGTSGKPTLNALRGANLINISIIIVRYFGGIKLGTGGLVRAYSNATNKVIKISELLEFKNLIKKTIFIEYSQISKFEYELTKKNILIIKKEFNEFGAIFTIFQ